MLEKAVLRYQDDRFGDFVSALVYYGSVALIVDSSSYLQLLSRAGTFNLERLIGDGRVEIVYEWQMLVVHCDNTIIPKYKFNGIYALPSEKQNVGNIPLNILKNTLAKNPGQFSVSKSDAIRFLNKVSVVDTAKAILSGAKSDSLDKNYIDKSIPRLLTSIIPTYQITGHERFSAFDAGDGIYVDTNLDFEKLNNEYHRFVSPNHSSITISYILAHFLTVRGDIFHWGDTRADIWAEPSHAVLMTSKVESLQERISKNRISIKRFEEFIFSARSFDSISVPSPEKFGAIVDFLLSAETKKFKNWLKVSPSRSDILREYDSAVINRSQLMQQLPVRLAKWITLSGGGIALDAALGSGPLGGLGGLALSASDEFLLSRIDLGWKPSQWVSRSARPLLGRE